MRVIQKAPLLNGSSGAMEVNGSVTPRVFSYTATGSCRVKEICVLVADDAASTWNQFGGLAALTNGVLIEAVQGGQATTIALIQRNRELAAAFSSFQSYGSPLVSALGALLGIGGTQFVFQGSIDLKNESEFIELEDGDVIRATVQDNLTNLVAMNMAVKVVREV